LVCGHRQHAERAHIYGVVGQALGEFREELLNKVEQMIEERADQLRADVNRGQSDGTQFSRIWL
jgi:hypothetical protein